jgi:hypothetical protein
MEAEVEALLTTVNFRLCEVSKELQSLQLGKASGSDGFPNECSSIFQKDRLCI